MACPQGEFSLAEAGAGETPVATEGQVEPGPFPVRPATNGRPPGASRSLCVWRLSLKCSCHESQPVCTPPPTTDPAFLPASPEAKCADTHAIAVCPNERFAFRRGQEACHEGVSPFPKGETHRSDAFPALVLAPSDPSRIGMSNPWTSLSLLLPSFRRKQLTSGLVCSPEIGGPCLIQWCSGR
jgi:hypothetical protein